MPLSAKITTKVAEYKNPDRSNYARIHNPENKKRRYTLCLTLIVLISWSSPVPARLWISSRWRPPMTCVYLHHLKNCRKNVIKIYLNRRIVPQKTDALCVKHTVHLFFAVVFAISFISANHAAALALIRSMTLLMPAQRVRSVNTSTILP